MKYSRIAIIGSAGVGKTTLLDSLFQDPEIAKHYSKIGEVVRRLCAERGYDSPYTINDDMDKFRHEVLFRQIDEENACDNFIVDRSTLDAWAYYMRWSWNTALIEDVEKFYQAARSQADRYDLLIYLPIMFEVKGDGYRWANPLYQKQVDRLLVSIVKDWDLEAKVYKLSDLSLPDRVDKVVSCLSNSNLCPL